MILLKRWQLPADPIALLFCVALACSAGLCVSALGNTMLAQLPTALPTLPAGTPRSWVDAAAANEQRILDEEDKLPLRYRVHKVDNHGDVVREVIESGQGNVARLIGRNAAPLSAEENTAERQRLEGILASPGEFLNHEQRDRTSRHYAEELIRTIPGAMLWSYAPGQPPGPGTSSLPRQIVLDFTPDPAFRPPTLVTEALTGIAGRVWIDTASHCITRIEGHVLRPVNFGWGGVLARIGEGGTLVFEQQEIGGGRWLYSRLVEHMTLREVLVRTVHQDAELNVFDIEHLPALPTYQAAVRTLLAIPVPTR